jgi:c-di-GMP-binding flagellar brake protein YcgR
MESHFEKERRGNVRIKISVPVHFVVFDSEAATKLDFRETIKLRTAMSQNLGVGGLGMDTDELRDEWINDLSSGLIKIALKFELPTSSISATAKVAWIKKRESLKPGEKRYILGLNFLDISTIDTNKIANLVVGSYFKELK